MESPLVTTVVLIIGGIVSWLIKSRIEELRAVQAKLLERKKEIYLEILDPFIIALSQLGTKEKAKGIAKLISIDYKRTAFEFNLIGSDKVVQASNDLWQHMYKNQEHEVDPSDKKELLRLWGKLLLEIRKDLGNKSKNFDEYDMFKFFITDLDNFKGISK